MKLFSRSSFVFKILSLLMIISLLAACGNQGGDGPYSSDDEKNTTGETVLGELPNYLGFVSDHEGQPIPYAVVGGTEIATEDGVASGDFEEYEGQWIPVEAPGYASSYAKTLVPLNEANFFESTLTPYLYMSGVVDEEESVLSASLEGEISITIQFSSVNFDQSDVTIGLTAIQRLDVTPNRVAFRSGDSLRLRVAFAVQAFTGLWDPAQLAAGSSIPLTIELENPLSDEAVFTTFDPVEGVWVEKDLDCTSEDGLAYSCQLPELNPLWAIFDQKDNFMAEPSTGSITQQTGLLSPPRQEAGNPQEDFNLAYDAWNQYMVDNLDNSNFSFSDPALLTLLDNIKKAAMKYAEKNRNEGGKKVLIKASEAGNWSGNDQMSQDLFDEAGKISEEILDDLLKDVSCGEQRKLLKGSEQVQLLTSGSKTDEQVMDKLGEISSDCDIWVGTIRVMMITANNHPADLPLSGRGGGWWQEIHKVKLWTDVDTLDMHGESFVRHIFAPVTYIDPIPCLAEVSMTGQPGDVIIDYMGKYNGVFFDIFSERPDGVGGIITQTWDINDPDDDGNCKLTYYKEFIFPNYFSLTVHGIGSSEPVYSLQQMLDDGQKSQNSLGDIIYGSEPFDNPNPDMGIFPFFHGEIQWRFIHAEKRLPKVE